MNPPVTWLSVAQDAALAKSPIVTRSILFVTGIVWMKATRGQWPWYRAPPPKTISMSRGATAKAHASGDLRVTRATDRPAPKTLEEVGERLNQLAADLSSVQERLVVRDRQIEDQLRDEIGRVVGRQSNSISESSSASKLTSGRSSPSAEQTPSHSRGLASVHRGDPDRRRVAPLRSGSPGRHPFERPAGVPAPHSQRYETPLAL